MKKTINVNLNGRVFTIDEDAYRLLESYFRNLRIHFRKEEGVEEIITDFEARVEELFSEKIRQGYSVISITQVEEVIARVGKPADFSENKESNDEKQAEKQTGQEEYRGGKRKFFRDPDDKIIAGICSGISIYFEWNVLPVRIVFLILILASGFWIIPVYLLVWMLSPEALTAEQKLQMQGEPITVENIGKTVAAGTENLRNRASNTGCIGGFLSFIGNFLKIGFIGLGCLIGIPLCFAVILAIIVLFSVLLGVGGGLIAWLPFTLSGEMALLSVSHPLPATISFIILLLIPLIALIYGIVAYFAKPKPLHGGIKWTFFIVWLLALLFFLCSGFRVNHDEIRKISSGHWDYGMTIRGNGIPGEKEYFTKSINAISVDNNLVANLQIEQIEGDSIFMLITGDENLVNEVKYEVVGDKLYLSTFNKSRFRSNNNVIISIKTPSLEKFKFKGAGRVSINSPFRVENLKIEMDGAGDLEAGNLIVQALTVDLDGVGSIRLAGHAEKVYLKTKGAGGINASQLISKDVTARLHGIGSIRCNPTEYLDAEVRGIGSISYKNDPKRKRIRTMGIGSVSKE